MWYRVRLEWEVSTATEGIVQKMFMASGNNLDACMHRVGLQLLSHLTGIVDEGHPQGSYLRYWLEVSVWNSCEDSKTQSALQAKRTPLTSGLNDSGPSSGSS